MICRMNANFCIADGHSWFLLFMALLKYYPKISLVSVRRFAYANSCRQLVLNYEKLTLTSRSIAIKALWIPSLKLGGIGENWKFITTTVKIFARQRTGRNKGVKLIRWFIFLKSLYEAIQD